ncbi:hypothetical protein HanRHA438_Chr16g0746841 [Helianthus annuus]|nr:hypothetical protein HanRHA438_Chr16g0746841 [Helianthus annuus]
MPHCWLGCHMAQNTQEWSANHYTRSNIEVFFLIYSTDVIFVLMNKHLFIWFGSRY